MRLLAISDLHVPYARNMGVVESIPSRPGDRLVRAGDVGETAGQVAWTLQLLTERFLQVVWVPGNHDLWTLPNDPLQLRGDERYRYLLGTCRDLGVLTPEGPHPVLNCVGREFVLAPLFSLCDYSFRARDVSCENALEDAYRPGVVCTDEFYSHPDLFPYRATWRHARVKITSKRLTSIPERYSLMLVNHYPHRPDFANALSYSQFALWCGTRLTGQWHQLFRGVVVVSGHLHIPSSRVVDGVGFEDVLLGYPEEWPLRGPREPRLIMPPLGGG